MSRGCCWDEQRYCVRSILENSLYHSRYIKYPSKFILIWYMGSSYGLTPFRINIIDYVKFNIPVKDVTKINMVVVIGSTLHKLINSNGKKKYFSHVCPIISPKLMFNYSLLALTITFIVVIMRCIIAEWARIWLIVRFVCILIESRKIFPYFTIP